jgi:hypothetical protein
MRVTLMLEISSIICFALTRVVFVPEECASVDHYFPVTGRYQGRHACDYTSIFALCEDYQSLKACAATGQSGNKMVCTVRPRHLVPSRHRD